LKVHGLSPHMFPEIPPTPLVSFFVERWKMKEQKRKTRLVPEIGSPPAWAGLCVFMGIQVNTQFFGQNFQIIWYSYQLLFTLYKIQSMYWHNCAVGYLARGRYHATARFGFKPWGTHYVPTFFSNFYYFEYPFIKSWARPDQRCGEDVFFSAGMSRC
jgi:hypothetical protein